MLTSILVLGLVGVAAAGEGDAEVPLAVPSHAPPPPARLTRPPERAYPQRVPGQRPPAQRPPPPRGLDDAALAAAIVRYREQEMALVKLTRTRTEVAQTYMMDPWWGAMPIATTYASTQEEIGVVRGGQRLDVPQVMAALGHAEEQDRLLRQIQSKRNAAQLGFLVGLGGLVTSAVGLVQMDNARDPADFDQWTRVTAIGLGGMGLGFVGGAIPSNRAHRLQNDLELSYNLDDLAREIEAHNAALAKDLKLTQAERARIQRLNTGVED